MVAEELRADLEADCWRFYRLWVDLQADRYPEGVSSERLVEMLERLPLYEGSLTARAREYAQDAGMQRPARGVDHSGRRVEEIGSSKAELAAHPAMAGLIEHVTV